MIPIGQRQLAEIKPEFDFRANKFRDIENSTSSGLNSEFLVLFQNSLSQNSYINENPYDKITEYQSRENPEKTNWTDTRESSNTIRSENDKPENQEIQHNVKDVTVEKKQEGNKEVLTSLLREKVSAIKTEIRHATPESKSSGEQDTMKNSEVLKPKNSGLMNLRETLLAKDKLEKNTDLKKPANLDLSRGSLVAGTTDLTSSAVQPKKPLPKSILPVTAKDQDKNQTQFEKIINNSNQKIQLKNKVKINDQQSTERADINPVKLSENAIVSRETISINRENKNPGNNTNDSLVKLSSLDKPAVTSSLKSDMNSDLSSNQNPSGFSMNQADKFNFMNKVNENPVLRQDMQQQIDQLLQRAKVIIRDNGNARLNARLNPKELGEISINLVLTDGKLRGRFTVDNNAVQKELHDKIEKLFGELKTEGYIIDGFQIDVKSETASGNESKNPFMDSVRNEFNKNTIGTSSTIVHSHSTDDDLNMGGIYA